MFTAPFLVALALVLSQLPRRIQHISIFLIVLSCFPSLYISKESHLAHVDNLRAIRKFYREQPDRPLYGTYETIAYLKYFDGFRNTQAYKDFTTSTPWQQESRIRQPIDYGSAYVVIDQYFLDFYTSRGHKFPYEIINPPSHWQPVFKYQRKPYFRNVIIRIIDMLYNNEFINSNMHRKITQKTMSWSHSKPVIIYATD